MKPRGLNAVRELRPMVRPYRYSLIGVLLCLIVLTLCNLAMPKVLGFVIDHVFTEDTSAAADRASQGRLLVSVLVVILAVYGLRNLLFYIQKTRMMVVGERTAFELRQRLIQHLHTLSVDFYQQNKPGKISARVLQDVQSVKQFIQDELGNMSKNVLQVLVAIGILVYMHWFLAAVTLAVLPLHVLVYYLFRKPITAYAREAKERIADVSGDLIEQFDGAATVKASATQLIEQEKFRESMRRGMRA